MALPVSDLSLCCYSRRSETAANAPTERLVTARCDLYKTPYDRYTGAANRSHAKNRVGDEKAHTTRCTRELGRLTQIEALTPAYATSVRRRETTHARSACVGGREGARSSIRLFLYGVFATISLSFQFLPQHSKCSRVSHTRRTTPMVTQRGWCGPHIRSGFLLARFSLFIEALFECRDSRSGGDGGLQCARCFSKGQ